VDDEALNDDVKLLAPRRVDQSTGRCSHHHPGALAVAMALHELATNAAKYGALSNGSGRISVDWTISERDEQHLQLVWTETGGPKVVAPSSKGFGSRLIERGLAGQLGGEAVIDYRETGVVCRILAPLSTVTGSVPDILS
jgi:two-component sensor histidine kinase